VAKNQVTVLYIMGLWRSGSTILDIILGSHAEVEGVGELRSLQAGWLAGAICACGASSSKCPFWSQVRERWAASIGGDESGRLMALQDRFERSRSLPTLLAEGLVWKSRTFREYARLLGALYLAIADVGGRKVVVDSTKYPARALALSRIHAVDLRIVHLVRDGRAVIWSWRRKANTDLRGNVLHVDADDVVREMTTSWIRANMLSGLTRKLGRTPSLRVLYEDLMADPCAELARIGGLVGVDFTDVANRLLREEPLEVRHLASGNRVRTAEAIKLRPDLEWHDKLPEEDRREFWRRAGWLARRYGYAE
jgi:hypothetical protein